MLVLVVVVMVLVVAGGSVRGSSSGRLDEGDRCGADYHTINSTQTAWNKPSPAATVGGLVAVLALLFANESYKVLTKKTRASNRAGHGHRHPSRSRTSARVSRRRQATPDAHADTDTATPTT